MIIFQFVELRQLVVFSFSTRVLENLERFGQHVSRNTGVRLHGEFVSLVVGNQAFGTLKSTCAAVIQRGGATLRIASSRRRDNQIKTLEEPVAARVLAVFNASHCWEGIVAGALFALAAGCPADRRLDESHCSCGIQVSAFGSAKNVQAPNAPWDQEMFLF